MCTYIHTGTSHRTYKCAPKHVKTHNHTQTAHDRAFLSHQKQGKFMKV